MSVELGPEVKEADLEAARQLVAEFRPLLRDRDRLTVEASEARINVAADRLLSLIKLVEGLHERQDEAHRDLLPEDAAALLGIATPTVIRLIERGDIVARKRNGRYALMRDDVLQYEARQSAIRRDALAALSAFSQEHGF